MQTVHFILEFFFSFFFHIYLHASDFFFPLKLRYSNKILEEYRKVVVGKESDSLFLFKFWILLYGCLYVLLYFMKTMLACLS